MRFLWCSWVIKTPLIITGWSNCTPRYRDVLGSRSTISRPRGANAFHWQQDDGVFPSPPPVTIKRKHPSSCFYSCFLSSSGIASHLMIQGQLLHRHCTHHNFEVLELVPGDTLSSHYDEDSTLFTQHRYPCVRKYFTLHNHQIMIVSSYFRKSDVRFHWSIRLGGQFLFLLA